MQKRTLKNFSELSMGMPWGKINKSFKFKIIPLFF